MATVIDLTKVLRVQKTHVADLGCSFVDATDELATVEELLVNFSTDVGRKNQTRLQIECWDRGPSLIFRQVTADQAACHSGDQRDEEQPETHLGRPTGEATIGYSPLETTLESDKQHLLEWHVSTPCIERTSWQAAHAQTYFLELDRVVA